MNGGAADMRNIRRTLWGLLILLSALWLLAEPSVFKSAGFFPVRNAIVQYSGSSPWAA